MRQAVCPRIHRLISCIIAFLHHFRHSIAYYIFLYYSVKNFSIADCDCVYHDFSRVLLTNDAKLTMLERNCFRLAGRDSMLNHRGTDTLKTQRLVLRPYIDGDGDAMYLNWASDEEVCRYLTWAPHGSVSDSRRIVNDWAACYGSECYYHWAITLDGELVGDIAVVRWNEQSEEAEIGYCLSRRKWGQGIMTEALRAVSLYLFDSIGFHRVMLRHDSENPASGRVMQKAGFRYEGCMKETARRRDGTWADLCLYGATRAFFQDNMEEQTL